MQKGMILFVRQGEEAVPILSAEELIETSRSLGVTAICVAVSMEEAIAGWWRLLARGIEQVLLMTVGYNDSVGRIESRGIPVRLCGLPIMN